MSEERLPVRMSFYHYGMFGKAVLYEPEEYNEKSRIAVICLHSDGDYSDFPAGKALAAHGYRVLCGQVSQPGAALDDKVSNIGEIVDAARRFDGVEKVVLLGHSGGATLMSAYQSVAEKGPEIYQGERMIVKFRTSRRPLSPADGLMLIDSNFGNGVMTLISVDPAVTDENDAKKLERSLDVFSPENGFDPAGAHYSAEFRSRFLKAQRERSDRIIDRALARLEKLEKGEGMFLDDEPFCVPGASVMAPNNKLFPQDVSLLAHTEDEYPLLHADGSVTVGVIPSLRKPRGDRSTTPIYGIGAAKGSVRAYLTSNAVRTTEEYDITETGIRGIDWDTAFCCTPGNVRHIDCPVLIMGMTAGYEYLAAETIYRNCPAADKEIAFVEGATHMLTPAKECEEYPGQFGDTVKTTFDYADKWLSAGRF